MCSPRLAIISIRVYNLKSHIASERLCSGKSGAAFVWAWDALPLAADVIRSILFVSCCMWLYKFSSSTRDSFFAAVRCCMWLYRLSYCTRDSSFEFFTSSAYVKGSSFIARSTHTY